jgi:phenylpropionate dioxygenase-like ring-hydroxylating dioxygenase large terminal subunit
VAHQDVLTPEQVAGVRKPLTQASTLPPLCYTSRTWYELEVERMWMRNWINIGRAEEIPNPGDYLRVDVIGEPVIMVRAQDGAIRVLSAACRHRGCIVVEGRGNTRLFSCPYHAWSYGLKGELVGVPGMREAENFNKADFGLVPVKTEVWGGFVFVNFDSESQPLMATLGELAQRLEAYRFEDMRVTRKIVNHVDCNWKIWLENSREGYHAPVVHKKSYERFFTGKTAGEWRYAGRPGVYEILSGGNDDGLYLPRNPTFPMVEGLSAEDLGTTHFVVFYPHLLLNIPPSHLAFHQLFPEGPDRTTVVTWICFPETTVARSDFEREVQRYYEIPEAFIPEDKEVVALVQKGLRARLAREGRFSVEERPCYGFANWLLDQVLGTEDAREVAGRR